jgi:hypothetical protein
VSALKPLSKPRFEALLYRRSPIAQFTVGELEWWTNDDESILGMASLDLVDKDYSWIILGRDETGVFRGIELDTCLATVEAVRSALQSRMLALSAEGAKEFPQGETTRKKQEILNPCVADARLHPDFKYLLSSPAYSPARGLLKELSFAFVDLDGNYKKDFQTTGFEGRLWELFLYAAFYELKFFIDDTHAVPDFVIENFTAKFAVEAVTVNASPGVEPLRPKTDAEERDLCKDYMPIKWGSPLYSKLSKRYWESSEIKGLPLVFAVHDFHCLGSMMWSLPALSDYLFGVRCGEDGRDTPVEYHQFGGKKIPSGFFDLPEAVNVSAVLASNEATLTKFNRMGKIAGFGGPDVVLIRGGVALDLEEMRIGPFSTETRIGVATETWSSGLWVFHNPNAKRPLPLEVFPEALNVFFSDKQREYRSTRRVHILRSSTFIGTPK